MGSIAGLGRSRGVGNGNPQYSCLENSMDRGAWRAVVHGVTKSQTQLSNGACTHTHEEGEITQTTKQAEARRLSKAPSTEQRCEERKLRNLVLIHRLL